jgi:hypothetical protein
LNQIKVKQVLYALIIEFRKKPFRVQFYKGFNAKFTKKAGLRFSFPPGRLTRLIVEKSMFTGEGNEFRTQALCRKPGVGGEL